MSTLSMPSRSPRQIITQDFGLGKININYSRPSIKGRDLFKENSLLAPIGKLWRMGADAATQISFSDDVLIEGKEIKAGTYLLFAIPYQNKWEIIFNTDIEAGLRGYNPEKNILKVEVPVQETSFFTETFTINLHSFEFENCLLELNWANTSVSIKIETHIVERLRESFEEQLKGEKKPFFQASLFNLMLTGDLDKALEYINAALEQVPNAFFMFFVKANIEKRLGQLAEAKKTAKQCFDAAVIAGNEDYQRLANDFIAKD